MPLLEVDALRTHFFTEAGVVRAVDGISFSVEAGETLGVVGESGCGKTVTALSVMGLLPRPPARIRSGSSIRLGGRELANLPERRLRRFRGNRMGMIFQDPTSALNPVQPVGRQIAEALRVHRDGSSRDLERGAVRLLGEVGIPDPERRYRTYPHQLSGGMQQRIVIAMAIACEPELLIADEPTTALDVTIQAEILELLDGLQEARGMGILLITHDLGVVAESCDRVAVMYAGQIVETGSSEAVFSDPRHPYTAGLLACLPDAARSRGRMRTIPGAVPGPLARPDGCRFRDRCPHAWGRCADEPPPLLPAEAGAVGRASRCWLEEEPWRARAGGAEAGT